MHIKAIDIRKCVFLALSAVMMVVVLLSASVSAASDGISVKGGFPGSNPVAGSVVTIRCGNQTVNPSTDSKGNFSAVFYKTADCNKGSILTGIFEDYYGISKVSNSYNTDTLQMRKTEAVPEFGTIAGLTALAGGVGFIIYNRRKQFNNI